MLTYSNEYFAGFLRPICLKYAPNHSYIMQISTERVQLCVTDDIPAYVWAHVDFDTFNEDTASEKIIWGMD